VAHVLEKDCGTIEAEANARLIAAAPELLTACIQAEKACSSGGDISRMRAVAMLAAAIAKVRGPISVQTSPAGTEFKITVPNTLAVIPCALVAAAGQQFGLPLASVLAPDAAQDTNPIVLGSLLGLPEAACGPTITIADSGKRLTLQVDALDGQRDIIVRPLRGPLPPLDILTGAGLNPDGSIIIILRPAALLALAFGCGLSPVQP